MINNPRKVLLKILPFVLFILISGYSFGQNSNKKKSKDIPFKERLSVGGSLGFSFGSSSSMIEVIPVFGFAVTEKFIVGLGLTYKYYRYNDYYLLTNTDSIGQVTGTGIYEDFKTNVYGGSIWARYFLKGIGIPIIENLFFHGEYEPLVFDQNFVPDIYGDYWDGNRYYSKGHQTFTLNGIFFGGGLQQPLGGRSYMYLEVLWNFNEEYYNIYSNPRIRIGVAVGI